MRRLLPVIVAAAVLAPTAMSAGTNDYQLRRVDLGAYPTVHLVVRGPAGGPAPTVYENGTRLTLTESENLGRSKALVLAIDRSQSMREKALGQAGAAADWLLQHKRSSDEAAVVAFASKAVAQTGFSQATIDGDSALRTLSTDPVQGTALYDAIVLSSQELGRQPLLGRVLVLLTDGRDVGSSASLADALRAAHRAGVVIYTIALGRADDGVLRRLAAASGGAFYTSPTGDALGAIYQRIGAELDRTWRLGYVTAARPGQKVTVSVGGASAGASVRTVLIPGAGPAQYHRWLPHVVLTRLGAAIVALAAGLLLFAIVLIAGSVPRSERFRRRVWQLTDYRFVRARTRPRGRSGARALLTTIDHRFRTLPRWRRIERLAERAGLEIPASAVIAVAALLALSLSLLVAFAASSGFATFAAFVVGLAAPFVALRIVAARRLRAFDNQLPDVLATMASSLRAGYGLRAALQVVVEEGSPPISVELRRVLSEARLGRPLEEALVSMCERLGWHDLLYVATAVEVQSQVGGSLAGVLQTVAETVRTRQQHRRRIRALTATARSSAFVIALLPFAFGALLMLINPHYMLPFLESRTGQILEIYSVISVSFGLLLLNRIVNIEE